MVATGAAVEALLLLVEEMNAAGAARIIEDGPFVVAVGELLVGD